MLEAPEGASLEMLALAGPELASRLAGSVLNLGDSVLLGGSTLVVRGADPPLPAKVSERTSIRIRHGESATQDTFDLIVLVDASRSMGESDVYPTRFRAAAYALHEFLAHASDVITRVEVTAFQGKSEPLAPFAPPEDAPLARLSTVSPSGPGDFARAIEDAFTRFETRSSPRRRAILLITDGDAYEAEFDGFGDRARNLGIAVHAVVIGGDDAPGLARACASSGGAYAEAFDESELTLRPVLERLAGDVDVPVTWKDASPTPAVRADTEDFEIVMRASLDEAPGGLASRVRRAAKEEDSQ